MSKALHQKRVLRIRKGSNHSKIVGDFAESLVCNWLSRSGFEVAIVKHTGIDLVGYHPKIRKRLGITVKSRVHTGTKDKHWSVNVLVKDDCKKLAEAKKAFNCQLWIAVYVENEENGDLYLTSLNNYEKKYKGKKHKVKYDWKMTPSAKAEYEQDKKVHHIRFNFDSIYWWRFM